MRAIAASNSFSRSASIAFTAAASWNIVHIGSGMTRVVSLDFPVGDWKEDTLEKLTAKNDRGVDQEYKLRLWTVKAK